MLVTDSMAANEWIYDGSVDDGARSYVAGEVELAWTLQHALAMGDEGLR